LSGGNFKLISKFHRYIRWMPGRAKASLACGTSGQSCPAIVQIGET
jgi:hypothetical protein